MAAASLRIPRTIFFPTSGRLFLRGQKFRKFSFSSSSSSSSNPYISVAKPAFRVSSEHNDFVVATKFPRPETVLWQKELANTVHLIGYISKPVQMKYTHTGKAFAWTALGVKLSEKATESTWFQLNFWQDMAEIAAEHVKERDQVYVSGYMNFNEVTDKDNNPRTFFQVVVNVLNFVEPVSGFLQEDAIVKPNISGSKTPMNALGTEKLWQAFFVNPTEWWDNRKDKKNPRAPDFKHKTTGEALWIESYSNPSWVKSQLDKLDEGMKFSQQFTKPQRSLSSFEDKDFHLF